MYLFNIVICLLYLNSESEIEVLNITKRTQIGACCKNPQLNLTMVNYGQRENTKTMYLKTIVLFIFDGNN